MDYRGQQFSEYLYYFLTIFFGAVAWVVGYLYNDFQMTVNGWAIGLTLAIVLCIPDWPMYNKHPVKWATKHSPGKDKKKAGKKEEKEGQKGKKGDR
jgi:signal peptidase complex subunit 1